ncbi:MAG: sugar ABC transporter permease [Anaerolineae bacterium]|nr:sugar ABC transporter permease [Anaerolineae bacterium]
MAITNRAQKKAQEHHHLQRYHTKWGYIFISPWIIGFLIFTLLPTLATLAFSFTNYSPVTPELTEFVGFKNYARMPGDAKVVQSLWVTVRYALLSIPLTLSFGLLLAILGNSKGLLGKNIFRTLFYMPMMIPIVAGAVIWKGVMNTQTGWINLLLGTFGIPGPDWVNSIFWITPAMILIGMWGVGNLMLTLMAGMQGVSTELYEAAELDGANGWQKFWNITLPMISPVLFYNFTLMLIGTFKFFDLAYVLKDGTGGPADQTLFYVLNFYKNSFEYNLMGYGSALAWVLFLIVLVLTVINFRMQDKWVYYAGEGRK